MTHNDILRMAHEADEHAKMEWPNPAHKEHWQQCRDERFAQLVAAAEREACADLCEQDYSLASIRLAKNIRARSQL